MQESKTQLLYKMATLDKDELGDASRRSNNEHLDIGRGVVTVALFVLLGKLAGAAKEMLVAWRYGVNADVDAYLFLFNLVNWPISLWLGLLTAVLIPVFSKAQHGSHGELRRFKEEFLGRSLLFGAAMAAIGAVAMLGLWDSSLTGFPADTIAIGREITVPMALLIPFGLLIGFFSVTLLAAGQHMNTLLESVPAIIIIIAILAINESGIEVLAWATVAGFACHAVCLAIPLREEIGVPRLGGRSAYWPAFWTGFSIMLVAQLFMSLTVFVDQFFAARLAEGALSTMNYAQRILALILGLGATAIGRAIIPVIAKSTDSAGLHLHRITMRWVWIAFAASTAVVVVGWWLAPWMVELLFERGAFTAQNTQAVTSLLRLGLFQIPFNISAVILFYALAGRQVHTWLAIAAATALLIKFGGNTLLVPLYGADGIMWSTGLMYAILMCLYLHMLRRTLHAKH
jgi:putative peptidoglycan lipid II flippase